jgi:BirA family transcriptional regulator, biotin operon repressor / biotin---[acetyl-CoA-carboxylase] ligase
MYEHPPSLTSADLAEIAAATRGKGRDGDDRVLFRSTADSTNTWARAEIGRRRLPFICIADHQTNGRGRHGRAWQDEPAASALMSVVVEAPPIESRSVAPLIAGEAVVRAVEEVCPGLRISLKWPNDLLIQNRKVGGLLVEAVSGDDGVVLILGIGINVHQNSFEPGMRVEPTSLGLSSGLPVNRPALIARICSEVLDAFNAPESWPDRITTYLERMHNLGGRATLSTGSSDVTGTIRGVADDGALLLETEKGLETFHAGDVSSQ